MTDLFDNYLELALGIVERSIADYILGSWWLNNNPERTDFTKKQAEKWRANYCHYIKEVNTSRIFFESQRFELIVNNNPDIKGYLYENMDKVAKIGKTVVIEGETRPVDNIFLDTAARMLTDRVREVIFNRQ